jgi:archaetidylinositol phosphate synthase
MKDAKRERAALTARVEKKALRAMAGAMPAPINSDHLTVLGVLAAFGVGAGYALSAVSPHWLWLSSVMLAVNWFGDSLDGTLARVRGAERPRYGYYLDHGVDAFTTAVIGAGIGLSPFVPLTLALALVLLYLVMSINVYLEAHVYGVFRMDYGVVGPTEARIVLIIINAGLVLLTTGLDIAEDDIRATATVVLGAFAILMLGLLLWRFAGNLRHLATLEPLQRGEDPEERGHHGETVAPPARTDADPPTGGHADSGAGADPRPTEPASPTGSAPGDRP